MLAAALVKVGSTNVDPPPSDTGRLRSEERIRVATGPGHTTVTPMSGAAASSSTRNVSLRPTIANLLAAYGALPPPAIGASPAIEATLTTWPVPRATIDGRK